ncbi:N-acetylmuramidase domain-containing protein [Chitiniphilus eburneus]|uniref:N-acetylmuramidase domain-containing protein n=1 Tax=Chitiniphilus eburneus TaxID=2571148 RepID=UPI0035CF7A63
MVTPLRHGSIGTEVRTLQLALNAAIGAGLRADGHFGDATDAAVRDYQRRQGLVIDGVAGAKTLATLTGSATPRLLREADLQAAADRLGVPLASVKAVNQVESRGSGFLADGRPVILYERHICFTRLQAAGEPASVLAAAHPDLINAQRGGYAGGAAEWLRLNNAARITGCGGIAREACSWGLFQVMGYHWQALGYASIAEFVQRMGASEGEQLEAFVRFVLADADLHKALKARRWAEFARRYNGPAYKTNLYDIKLQRAYEQFAGEGG